MNWKDLYFGHMPIKEVLFAVNNEDWQKTRLAMKGKTLQQKFDTLTSYLNVDPSNRERQVRVTNYVTALSRGGLIKPSDYH